MTKLYIGAAIVAVVLGLFYRELAHAEARGEAAVLADTAQARYDMIRDLRAAMEARDRTHALEDSTLAVELTMQKDRATALARVGNVNARQLREALETAPDTIVLTDTIRVAVLATLDTLEAAVEACTLALGTCETRHVADSTVLADTRGWLLEERNLNDRQAAVIGQLRAVGSSPRGISLSRVAPWVVALGSLVFAVSR